MAPTPQVGSGQAARNRAALAQRFGVQSGSLTMMHQIHGNGVVRVTRKYGTARCDALVTNLSGVALTVLVADCVPMLFFDPGAGAIAAVHAGRNGTFLNIGAQTVAAMQREFGTNPKDLQVFMGASIHRCCYEVSQQMADIVTKSYSEKFVEGRNIDLQGINRQQLLQSGVLKEQITVQPHCTKCGENTYFSYRKEKEKAGRFAGVIMLAP